MFIKPAPGRIVPDPEMGGLLRPDGRTVQPTQFWLRRIEEADVIEVDPAPTLTATPEAE